MGEITRGTTPTPTFKVAADLSGFSLHLAFSQFGLLFVKTSDDLTVTVDDGKTFIDCPLTQADTLKLDDLREVEVQLRAINDAGAVALATKPVSVPVGRILQDGVLID